MQIISTELEYREYIRSYSVFRFDTLQSNVLYPITLNTFACYKLNQFKRPVKDGKAANYMQQSTDKITCTHNYGVVK